MFFENTIVRWGARINLSQSPLYIGVSTLLRSTQAHYLCIADGIKRSMAEKRINIFTFNNNYDGFQSLFKFCR